MINSKVEKNYPLAELSTYKIGGAAEYFIAVENKVDLPEVVQWATEQVLPITILGGGSNILINDTGVQGLVIKIANDTIDIKDEKMICGAGSEVKQVAETAFEYELSGIEWSIGIPGGMGGAIRGNAGAHGGSFDKVVTSVEIFDMKSGTFKEVSNSDCGFQYRHSLFKDDTSLIVWEINMQLQKGNKVEMEKAMEEYREYRRQSQPKEPSAGCVFKNLLVTDVQKINPDVVAMAEADGKVRGGKIGAGYLIQKLGLRGYQVGGAMISDKHANFVPNTGTAKASDVIEIMSYVRQKVKEAYGIEIEDEVQLIGFN